MSTASIKSIAFPDLDRELAATRKVLERLPESKFEWQPRAKSMALGRLAMHVATIPIWMLDTIQKDGMDMANPPKIPQDAKTLAEVLKTFDDSAASLRQAFAAMDDVALTRDWTLRHGEKLIFAAPRSVVLRTWCLSHMIHHRGQLCVFLRQFDIPVPAVYFNSADEPEWVFA